MSTESQAALVDQWRAAWPNALAVWSKFTRLHEPVLAGTRVAAAKEGLHGSFAMIRLVDQSVVIDLQAVAELGLADYALEVLAHEIGHHVLAPGSAADYLRLLARIRRALPTLEVHAARIANLYTDLYINDRLQRHAGLRMADIYRRLAEADGRDTDKGTVWALYMRMYEYLWKLDKGALHAGAEQASLDTDAWLGARLIRVHAADYMAGAGRFATLLLPYLVDDTAAFSPARHWQDTGAAAAGCEPAGVHEEDEELDDAIHPADDPRITGDDGASAATLPDDVHEHGHGHGRGQQREPFAYGELLRAGGITLTDHEIAMRYYRERALPHLVPFPSRPAVDAPELQLEALEPWEMGDPLDDIDWLHTLMQSPRPIPGVTTVRRAYGHAPARVPDPMPVDLDMYVDSSGSMPNPAVDTSYLALAGAIIALSALRAGSHVKVTLWSGTHQHMQTDGFCRDEDSILRVLTGFYGGGTAFPIHRLRETCSAALMRPTHILMISDEGITTMFNQDEQGNSGWDIAARALDAGGAGGTMALNLHFDPYRPDRVPRLFRTVQRDLQRARDEQGWRLHVVTRHEDLLDFARAFSQRHYADRPPPGKRT